MQISFDLLALALGIIAILAVGVLAWRRNRSSGTARSFFIATLAFAVWLTTNYLSLQPYSLSSIDFYTRLSYVAGFWVLVTTWNFCFRFPIERKLPARTRLLLAITFIGGSLFSFSPLVVDSVSYSGRMLIITPGEAYWLYGVVLAVVALSMLINLRRNYTAADLLQRNQIRYVAFGVGVVASLSLLFNVVLVLLSPEWGSPLINLLITLVVVVFLGYALIRHRYMEVHRLVSWLFTYVICLGLLAGLLVAIEAGLTQLYPSSVLAQRSGILIAASILVLLVQPVTQRIKLRADKLFNVGWYDSQTLLSRASVMLAGELHLAPLLRNSVEYICIQLQLVGGKVIVLGEENEHVVEGFGDWPGRTANVDVAKLPKTSNIIVVDELSSDNHLLAELERNAVRISVPLRTRGRHVGYLFLGIKQRGDIFSAQDIAVLQILSSQLAVAIVSAQAYEQISQFNDTLQEKIDQATLDLRKAQEKLKLDDRMKTEFIILTSHNLRTPLTIIKNYISILEDSHLTNNQHAFLDSMKSGTNRLSQFTEDLLTIDSIVSGDQLVLQPVAATDILQPLVKEAAELAKAKQLTFKTDIAVDGLVLNANPLRLSSAIRQLLDNAFKFTEHGEVGLSATRKGDHVSIAVTDTGIGIATGELPTLFTKFHRATDVMTTPYEGEGIGLYLTGLVVKEHAGRISATSKLHKGSHFEISLPVVSKSRVKS